MWAPTDINRNAKRNFMVRSIAQPAQTMAAMPIATQPVATSATSKAVAVGCMTHSAGAVTGAGSGRP